LDHRRRAPNDKAFDEFVPESPALPFAELFPSPQQALDATFGFAERLLANQRSFASDLASVLVSPNAKGNRAKSPAV
jgi:hypothetical protein